MTRLARLARAIALPLAILAIAVAAAFIRPALAQQPAPPAPAAAPDTAACTACAGFAQAVRMVAQVVASLQREIELSQAKAQRITTRLLDEGRRETAEEKAELERLGRHMKAIEETILPAWRAELDRMRATLKTCNETYCKPDAPPQTAVRAGSGFEDLVLAAATLMDVDLFDFDDDRRPRRATRARCPECQRFEDRLTEAGRKYSAAWREEDQVNSRYWELQRSDARQRARDLRESIEQLDARNDPGEASFRAELVERLGAAEKAWHSVRDELRVVKKRREELLQDLKDLRQEMDWAQDDLETCNRERCRRGEVRVGSVIGLGGTNPFDPSNPIGTGGTGAVQPPPNPNSPGSAQFSSATYSGAEGGAVLIIVARTGGTKGAVSVGYATAAGSATAGADFAPASGRLAWADGDAAPKSFSIALPDDNLVEDTETFTVSLSDPQGGVALGAPATTTVSIVDNDSPPPPQPAGNIQFSASAYATAEGQGSVVITATRTGGSSGAITVQYFTGPGSATAGADYQAVNGTLAWANGDSGAKTFTVPIVDDTLVEGPETFFVTLNSPTGGATLGAPATATVTIADNDVATGPCGSTGSAWQPNTGASYACTGTCNPCPSPQTVTVSGDRVTVSPFHAGGAATFTGCSASLTSDSGTLTYFGQSNHRATITRTGSNNFSSNIVSSGGGSCTMSCFRTGP